MNTFKKLAFMVALTLSTALPIIGCTSTTQSGSIGINRKQLLLVSQSEMMSYAEQAYQKTITQARKNGILDVNATQVARLKRIASRLINHTSIYRSDASGWGWQVHVIDSPELNAYVMPNGKIIFYSGIIKTLNLTDDEIAAIMGHEMAHALREHSREQVSRQIATQGTLGIAGAALGLSSGQMELAGALGNVGLALPHSRTQETEADKIGLELMARAGYNPQAGISLWQKMQKASEGEGPQFLSTHPNPANRINVLQALMPTVMPLYEASK